MDLPRRPSENEDPWYSAREAYDDAIEETIRQTMRSRGEVPSGTHFDDMSDASWQGLWYSRAGELPSGGPPGFLLESHTRALIKIEYGGLAAGIKQEVTKLNQSWYRTGNRSISGQVSSWGNWLPSGGENSLGSASDQILDLAVRDGWLAVFDPTVASTLDATAVGDVNVIRDRMGNLPDLVGSAGTRPQQRAKRLGAFDGLYFNGSRNLENSLPSDFPVEFTLVTIARTYQPNRSTHQYLFDSTSRSTVRGVYIQSTLREWRFIDNALSGISSYGSKPDEKPHVITAHFHGDLTNVVVDGQLGSAVRGSSDAPTSPMSGFRLGASAFGVASNGWRGDIGPVLIYPGVPSVEVLSRMTDILHAASGIPYAEPKFSDRSRIYSEDEFGNVTATRGDTALISRYGIASMTKVMTAITARKYLTTEASLDQTVMVHPDDVNNNTWRAGDIISYRDLMYGSAIVSSDATPRVIARHVGGLILGQEGSDADPIYRFVEEMNTVGEEIGLVNAAFGTPPHSSYVSPRDMVKMMKYARQDSALAKIFGDSSRTITVEGSDARTFTLNKNANQEAIPGYVMGKTGGALGGRHICVVWTDHEGIEHTTSIHDTPQDSQDRFVDLFSLIAHQYNGARKKLEIAGGHSEQARTHRYRGRTPVNSNVDKMRGEAWTGVWAFTSSISPINMPFDPSSSGTLEIIDGGSNLACKQILTIHTQQWWREIINMDDGGNWGEWYRVATKSEVDTLEERIRILEDRLN